MYIKNIIINLKDELKNRFPKKSLRRRLLLGSFWSLISSIFPIGLGFVGSIITSRLLGKTGFGEFGMIRSTIELFVVYAGFGLGLTSTKYVAELRDLNKDRAGNIIGMSSLVALFTSGTLTIGLFFFAPFILSNFLNAPHLVYELRVACLFLFVGGLNNAQNGILAGFEAFKDIAKVSIYSGIISFFLSVGGVFFYGLIGAVWALALTRGVQWLLNHLALRRVMFRERIKASYKNIKSEFAVLWKFSLPAVIASSLTGLVGWTANAMLVNQPNGYSEMGIFTAANQWRTYLLLLPAIIGQVILPILSERVAKNDVFGIKKTLIASIITNLLLTLPVGLLLIIFRKYIMSFYGTDFISGTETLTFIILFTILLSAMTPIAQIITANGKMWLGFFMNCVWGVVLLVSFSFLKPYGAFGLAISFLIANCVHAIWTYKYAWTVMTVQNN